MRRVANAEIVLGAFIGLFITLLFVGVDLYQTDRCIQKVERQREWPSESQNPQQKVTPAKSEDEEREQGIANYAKSHPAVCGVAGLPRMLVGFMDHHEGFFVGIFTLALFGATCFLWRSTEKLWDAGERQIENLKGSSEKQLRAYVGVKHSFFKAIGRGPHIEAVFLIKNFGATPARLMRAGIHLEFFASPSVGSFAMPEEIPETEVHETLMPEGESIVVCELNILSINNIKVRAKQQEIHAVGRIDYVDAFGKAQFTAIRWVATGDRAFSDSPFITARSGNEST